MGSMPYGCPCCFCRCRSRCGHIGRVRRDAPQMHELPRVAYQSPGWASMNLRHELNSFLRQSSATLTPYGDGALSTSRSYGAARS
jgi:hypothetical protein